MASSKSVVAPSAATDVFFNSRFPQYEIPVGDASTVTSRASSIASAIQSALTSGTSIVYVPNQYAPYRTSNISSYLSLNVYLIVEGG